MGHVAATFSKTIKESLREKAALFWTIGWPIIWVLIGSFSFTGGAPEFVVPYIRASITVSMAVFALMIAGMAGFPGSIAEDRERGLLFKLMAMPVRPWRDFAGRILGLWAFSYLALILVVLVGFLCGARFSLTVAGAWGAIGYLLLISLTTAGIGMLIGTFIKHVQGAIMTGVGVAVVTAAISGVMAPYRSLPRVLQHFARLYPISSANSSVVCLLVGKDFAGYNPLSTHQVALTIVVAFLVFSVGLFVYSRLCWKRG